MQLVQSNNEANIINAHELEVKIKGPIESLYENGVWVVRVLIPKRYPYRPPAVIFKSRILHPNINEQSGAICMNVLHEAWTPVFNLNIIFESFIPELLRNPNVNDPLNISAASLYKKNKELYDARVRQYVIRYATEQQVTTKGESEPALDLSDNNSIDIDIEFPSVTSFGISDAQAAAEDVTLNALNLEAEMEEQTAAGNTRSLSSNVVGNADIGGSVQLQSSSLVEETTNEVSTPVEAVLLIVEDVNSLVQLEDIPELDENINVDELLIPFENVEHIAGEGDVASMQSVINEVQLERISEDDERSSDDSEQESVIDADGDQLENDVEESQVPGVSVVELINLESGEEVFIQDSFADDDGPDIED
ncbi:uncharacterized protein LOC119682312 [Teleopsis dalmanni]|uniref:uncharacterized protein LOC119682312 n=1 Tax=Teleopsis dalmanni TaxID=139649 RepID=UPI0018CC8CBC|nr:uncharacterized protein LOC119682312 [Teleopsis dalmanni]